MTETTSNPTSAEEIRLGVANACLMMPAKSEDRRDAVNELYARQDREKDLVKEAREEADVAGQMKRLHKVHGVAKATIQIMKILDKVAKPGDRAAVLTQVGLLSKDVGYCDKDLVSLAQEAEATAGQQADDQGSVFDNTSEGQRRGGKDAEPKHVEQPAAAPAAAATPGIPLDQALAAYESARNDAVQGGWNGKGRRPKAVAEAAKVLEAAEKAKLEAEAAEKPAEGEPAADEFDEAKADAPAEASAAPPPAPRRAGSDQAEGRYRLN